VHYHLVKIIQGPLQKKVVYPFFPVVGGCYGSGSLLMDGWYLWATTLIPETIDMLLQGKQLFVDVSLLFIESCIIEPAF